MAIDTTRMPYRALPDDSDACAHCGSGLRWLVVGPDEVALGISFENEEAAEDLADNMSRAYLAGAQDALKSLQEGADA